MDITTEDREAVAERLHNSPAAKLDPAAPLLVQGGFCPLCSAEVTEVRDELSLREYRVSGLCQSCQDIAFGEESTDPEVVSDLADREDLRA